MMKFASTSFAWSELFCKCGCGNMYIQDEAIDKLQKIRNIVQVPLIINSAARCPMARLAGFKGFGIHYNSFVHVDNRKFAAVW